MGRGKKRKHNKTEAIPEDEIKQQTENNDDSQQKESKNVPETTEPQSTENNQQINRRARIIVRNLSFKSTEAKLKEYFEKFGTVVEVKLLKKPDGKLVGCGFVQYQVTQNAAKAIFHTSGKPFLGRDIVCDWALGKNTYVKNMENAMKTEIKAEGSEVIEIKDVKDEKIDVKSKDNDDDSKSNDEDDKSSDEDDKSSCEAEDTSNDESEDEKFNEDDKSMDTESQRAEEPEVKRPRVMSNDIQEGKTVFIKNVPFSANNNDIRKCMEQFGPLYYALVCMDSLTEHSKGTAFVKFLNQEDAEKCLEAGTELTIMGQVLDCHRAVSKSDLDKNKAKKEVKKDSRNLYLIKEGVILAGTRAAQSVSVSDMAKRLELERWKTQILRNLNMFISKNRLIIHNLPPTYDDKELKDLFTKFSGPTTVIKEAKVMKDLRNLNDEGKPTSKEHGFVSFVEHDDALRALRVINNNPSIFTKTKRPIVAFSIENKSVINARNKRLIKSRLNNPTSQQFNTKGPKKETENKSNWKSKKPKQKFRNRDNAAEENQFSGVTAKPGTVSKMRSKYKLTTQAQIHHETLKKEKTKLKLTRKVLNKRKADYLKQAKHKKGKGSKKEKDDNFTKIVNNYTQSSGKSSKAKKRKWYES